MRRTSSPVFAAALSLMVLAGAAPAFQPGTPPARRGESPGSPSTGPTSRLTLTTERVIIFKNGYALVVKSARGRCDGEGNVYLTEVPPAAVLGTFWVTSPDHQVRGVRATMHESTTTETLATRAQSVSELVAANIGRKVTLHTTSMPKTSYYGTVLELLDGQRRPPVQRATRPPMPRDAGSSVIPIEEMTTLRPFGSADDPRAENGQFAVIREDDGNVTVIPIGRIYAMSDPAISTSFEREVEETQSEKRLIVSMGKELAEREVALNIMYFTPGVRWIPTYKLEGVGEPQGRLSLQGELLNELEDFTDVPMSLVVGVPSFRFKDTVSPLSLEPALYNALEQAAPQLMGQQVMASQFSNAYYADRAGERSERIGAPAGLPDPADEGVGAGEQDLFVYDIGKFSMHVGDRATIPLWATTQDVEHVYTFELDVRRDEHGSCTVTDKYGTDTTQSPLRFGRNRVWHQLELKNATKAPWTTGAAMVFDGPIPISQEMLLYTSPGASAQLPLTVATDIRGAYAEEEINREANVLRWGSNQYSRLTKRCTITLTSYRQEASSMRINVSMGGRAREATDEGKIVITDSMTGDWSNQWWAPVNNHSDLAWSLDLKPGESKTLTFTVEYYVP